MNGLLIYHISDIIQIIQIQMNTRWHEGKIIGVAEKTQNDWSGSEICEIWTQKHRPIPVILWFAFLHISQNFSQQIISL